MALDLAGPIDVRSPWMSPIWSFTSKDGTFATARRRRRHPSVVTFADGSTRSISHDGWDGVVIMDQQSRTVARATRTHPLGRTWQLDCERTSLELNCESMLRRHWTIGPPGAPFADLRGGVLSFNSMRVDTGLPIPVDTLLLSWQIIVRSWEAAAASKVD